MKKMYLVYVCSLVIGVYTIASREWVGLDSQVSLYAPALLQSQASTVYYTGAYTSPAGNRLRCRKGYEILHPNHTHSFDFSEIAIDRSELKQGWGATMFLDMLRAGKYTFLAFMGDIRMPRGVWSDPSTRHALDLTKINIGQQGDLGCLERAYRALVCDKDVVLFGFSRGAATVCNFLSGRYIDQPRKCVKAAVLSGCFDSLESVFDQRVQCRWLPGSLGNMIYKGLRWMFPSLGVERVEPIDVIAQFPKDVPVLFISSKLDAVVPTACTYNLVRALVQSGHEHVYYLELSSGAHARHYLNSKKEHMIVNTVVHAFYKKYQCAYCPELADEGLAMLQSIHCDIVTQK